MNNLLQNIVEFDRNLFLTVNQLQSIKLNKMIGLITKLGGLYFQSILALGMILYPPTRGFGIKFLLIQIIVTVFVQIIKIVVARIRPYNALAGIVPFKIEKDYSFPSGHTAASFTTALTLSAAFPIASIFYFGLASIIGYSRIYIGVHYPTDVIAGGIIGLIVTSIILTLGLF